MLASGPSRVDRTRRPLLGWDVACSGLALVLAGTMIVAGVIVAGFLVAVLDNCPPSTCSPSRGLVSVGGSLVVAVAAGIAGCAMTVLRIVERRQSWPFAVATLVLAGMAIAVGALGYAHAVGW